MSGSVWRYRPWELSAADAQRVHVSDRLTLVRIACARRVIANNRKPFRDHDLADVTSVEFDTPE
jgi:hypothetical protein